MKKKLWLLPACVFAAILLAVVGYLIYVFAAYERLEDHLVLSIENNSSERAAVSGQYSVVTWNIGFGAYSSQYSFFMDGGTESRAYNEEAVYSNIGGAVEFLSNLDADFCMIEEVDVDATRSYHIDERELILPVMAAYGSVYAQNYDSPYLFYPILEPHGASKSGMLTLSKYEMSSCLRRSLPVETGVTKFLDLDRCYSVSRVPLDNGKELCLYCVHLSAYSSDGKIGDEQFAMLCADMQKEYESGNYVVCGGDFNKDLLGDSGSIFGVSGANFTWAQPVCTDLLPEGFSVIAPLDALNPVPSCRNADIPYQPGESFVVTVDGFVVSPNVVVTASEVVDTGFAWSDHNPVRMAFTLE